MNVADVRRLLAYNQWANSRLLSVSRHLSAEDFTRDLRSSHSSVRGTLVHIIGGHWVWLRLWLGDSTQQIVARCDVLWTPASFPDVATLETAQATLEKDQASFIEGLTDERVVARVTFESFQGQQCELSLGEMIQHVVNHSTYHRGQVAALLRHLGQAPPGTDYSTFLLLGSAA